METRTKVAADIRFSVHFVLDENQARALAALTAYGASSFLKVFYEHMGKTCLSPSESGLRRLFRAVDEQVLPELERIDTVRALVEKKLSGKAKRRKR